MARRGSAVLHVLAVLAAVLIGVMARAGVARADQPGAHTVPVAVLALDSDDAEEQAEALTGALRSRIRAAQGWSLTETTQSLSILTAALKCPPRPPPECQQKIADQLKSDRYIWGFVAKGPAGQVTAEIHLFQRGKSDTPIRESYADNLKDSNDDTLRKIAGRFVERLGGTAMGVVVVRGGPNEQTGEVVIDGEKRVPLKDGTARLELAAGGHAIELAAPNGTSTRRNVLVTAGRETIVEFSGAAAGGPAAATGSSPFPLRKLAGGTTMLLGVGLGVVGVVGLVNYLDAQSEGEAQAKKIAPSAGAPSDQKCREVDTSPSFPSCKYWDDKSRDASTMGWVAGSLSVVAIGVGAWLYFGADSSSSSTAGKAKPAPPRVVPSVGTTGGSLTVLGTF